MSKKNFKTSFDDLLMGKNKDGRVESGAKSKKLPEETKATFVVRRDQLELIKAISYTESKMIKNILEEALSLYITTYKKTHEEVILPRKKEKTH